MKLFLLEDDSAISMGISYSLTNEGYCVTTASSVKQGLEIIKNDSFSLYILDLNLPDGSGYDVCKEIKKQGDLPVIFLTAYDDEINVVTGFELGADDYMKKPLSIKEVKARIKAVLRRAKFREQQKSNASNGTKETPATINYQGICIKSLAKSCTIDGVPVQLTKLEFELLLLFLSNPDTVFSRDELLCRCWPSDTYVLDRTVDVNITRLRKKIGQYGKQLKTRFGYGYVFETEIVQE